MLSGGATNADCGVRGALSLQWPSGIGSRLGRNRLRVRFLAVSDTYSMFTEPTINLVLWLHMA